MKTNSRPADLYIRLPKGKAKIKAELVKIAANSGITLNRLMVAIAENFLEQRKEKDFYIKLS